MAWRAAPGAGSPTSGPTSGLRSSPTTLPSSPGSSRPDRASSSSLSAQRAPRDAPARLTSPSKPSALAASQANRKKTHANTLDGTVTQTKTSIYGRELASMPAEFLHRRGDFNDLIRIVANEMEIDPALVEKDYWIMQSLYGLQQLGLQFQLKGGTSLSKGYGFIDRFSEDIDIRIEPDPALGVATGPNHNKPAHVEGRKAFYDHLGQTIRIDGIVAVERDMAFDDTRYYRGAGIRLIYESANGSVPGLKDGILLEAGFDDVAPNLPK